MATETAQQILARHEALLRDLRVRRPVQSGQVTITPSAANVATSAPVTFPMAYTDPPLIVASPISSGAGVDVGVTGVTTTGALVWLTRPDTTATVINWIAHG